MSEVETHHGDRGSGAEHHVGRLRVGKHVELGGCGHVPNSGAPAHQGDRGHSVGQGRIRPQGQRHVG